MSTGPCAAGARTVPCSKDRQASPGERSQQEEYTDGRRDCAASCGVSEGASGSSREGKGVHQDTPGRCEVSFQRPGSGKGLGPVEDRSSAAQSGAGKDRSTLT